MLPLPPVWVALALALAPVRAPVSRRARPMPIGRVADSLVAAAAIALERGRPWQASRLIAVVLADSARRTPDAVMLAATAASRWGGWPRGDPAARRAALGGHVPTTAEAPAAAGPRGARAGRRFGRAAPRPGRAGARTSLPRTASASCFLPRRSSGVDARDSAAAHATPGRPSGSRASPDGSASGPPR